MATTSFSGWLYVASYVLAGFLLLYLFRINQLLKRTPAEIQELAGPPWTAELLNETYERLSRDPLDYTNQLPPKLERRYIVTGGNGEPYSEYFFGTVLIVYLP
jgi:hypothetical protein